MNFINILLTGGVLAFTIPLAIHLLFRSRFTTIDWGAWQLLDSVVRTNRKRMQLSNLLLLLLRCAIPILLALCLARPVLTGFKSLPGDEPRSIVVALDDSRSMMVALNGQPTRFEQAKNGLADLFADMTRRDEVILLTSTTVDSPPITTGPRDAISTLRSMRAQGGPVDLGRLTEAAVSAAEQCSHSQCTVIVASDFQNCNVGRGTVQSLERLAERIGQSDPMPAVSFWSFAKVEDEISNLSVDAVEVNSPAIVAGRNAQLSARVRNASDNPARDLRVVWSVDGVALAPRLLSVDPRASATTRLSHRLDDPGAHEITVSVEHGDALAEDNRRTMAVNAMREINVVLVDGRPSSRPLEGQADFLSMALSPFAFGGDDQPDSVSATVISPGELTKTLGRSNPEIVILANDGRISDQDKQTLASFVFNGGSLVVFDGDRVKPADFNEAWACDEGSLLFPARLGDIQGDPKKKDATTLRLGELNPLYTPWKLLAPGDERPLADVEVSAFRKLSVIEPEVDAQGVPILNTSAGTILLRMGNGDPVVVSASRGRGQVMQFALPCNTAWSTLPLRMIYLPMMQQMVLDLAGRRKTTTLDVGQPIAVDLREFEDKDEQRSEEDKSKIRVRFTVETPTEGEIAIEVDDQNSQELTWANTNVPGTYTFRRLSEDTSKRATESDSNVTVTKTVRVVEIPETESQLRLLGAERLGTLAEKLDANIYSSLSDIQSDDRTRRFGREIWRWLLALLLFAMIAELFLQQNLVSRAPAKGAK